MRVEAINGCPVVSEELWGWPKNLLSYCIYKDDSGLKGSVYVLNIAPEVIARWIETSCSKALPGSNTCFTYVLACGKWNSSYIFPVSGNVIEDGTNFFFRNGITVNPLYDGKTWNWTRTQLDIDNIQNPIAMLSDSEVAQPHDKPSPMPSGLARFWRTLPAHFAKTFEGSGAPMEVSAKGEDKERQKWLDIVRNEVLGALNSPEDRLLMAYLAAHPQTIGRWSQDPSDAVLALKDKSVGDQVCPQESWP